MAAARAGYPAGRVRETVTVIPIARKDYDVEKTTAPRLPMEPLNLMMIAAIKLKYYQSNVQLQNCKFCAHLKIRYNWRIFSSCPVLLIFLLVEVWV